jgi:hypothetical protein
MKKIIRLTESDLTRIVKRVIEESDVLPSKLSSSYKSLLRAWDMENGEDENIDRRTKSFFKNLGEYSSSKERALLFRRLEDKYGKLPNHISKHYDRIYNLNEELGDENSCEDFISRMRDIYEETQSFISRKSDKIRKSDEFRKSGGIYVYTVYEILEDQLGYIVDMAEEMECDNYYDLLEMYEEYTETIAEILELDKTKLLNL